MDAARLAEHVKLTVPHLTESEAHDLARMVGRIVEALSPERVYLFGSRARGDHATNSDYDLLVVVPDTDVSVYDLDRTAYRAIGPRDYSVDVITITASEFRRRSGWVMSLPAIALREGKRLYAA
jgi:predicted nucleotidyltransferase